MNPGIGSPHKVHILPASYRFVELIAIQEKGGEYPPFFLNIEFNSLQ